MRDNDTAMEPRLSAERMASLDGNLRPRAEVEERVVGALRGHGVLHNNRAPQRVCRAAGSARRSVLIAGLATIAATVLFFTGMKVGEHRSNLRALRTAPDSTSAVASNTALQHLIWY